MQPKIYMYNRGKMQLDNNTDRDKFGCVKPHPIVTRITQTISGLNIWSSFSTEQVTGIFCIKKIQTISSGSEAKLYGETFAHSEVWDQDSDLSFPVWKLINEWKLWTHVSPADSLFYQISFQYLEIPVELRWFSCILNRGHSLTLLQQL